MEARERNWRIRRLRGIYAQVSMLTGLRREAAQQAIDEELALLGAEPQGLRWRRYREELEAEIADFSEVDQ